ncbi:MAG: NUDIX domain-containing protein [Bacteroidales bacterium]
MSPITKPALDILKFCPRCGSNRFMEINNRARQCSDCAFILYINSAAAVVALICDPCGNVLFTVRKHNPGKGTLDLPGGFIDPGETAEIALKREIAEELNLNIVEYEYKESYPNTYLYGGMIYFTLDMLFLCKIESFESIKAADDVEEYKFLPLSTDLIPKIGLQSIKIIVETYCKKSL